MFQSFKDDHEAAWDLQTSTILVLDAIFPNIGVLFDVDDIDAAPKVPVLEPGVNSNKVRASEGNEDQPILSPDHMDSLKKLRDDRGKSPAQVGAELGAFRGSYGIELLRYIAQAQLKPEGNNHTAIELEASFGPVWLSRHKEISSKMVEATQDYFEADRQLTNARCNKKIASPHEALRPDEGPFIDSELVKASVDVVDVVTYGKMLSGRERAGIEFWVLSQHSSSALSQAKPSNSDTLAVTILDSGEGKLSMAQGYLRAKIYDYERYVGRGHVIEPSS